MLFYIMNKDVKVAEFLCETTEGINRTYITNIYSKGLLPLSIRLGYDFSDWLNSRLILSHRKNVIAHFNEIGLKDKEDILSVTKGVSLNDTFWIKPLTSSQKWVRVSPYINPLNRDIADYAFKENNRVIANKHITSSPDFSTSGNFPKCWKKFNGVTYLIKGGSVLGINKGNEPFSEIFADEVLTIMGIDHIKYIYIKYKGLDATKCANMCTEKIGIYPLYLVLPDVQNFEQLLNRFKNDNKTQRMILDTLLFDYMSLNTDRHWGNISFFVDNDTQKILGLTPIYDNNLSFIPYYIPEIDNNIDSYINNSNGVVTTSTGQSFEELFRLIDCKYVREKLSLLRNFKFTPKYKRYKVANEVLKRQLSLIIYK